MNCHETREQLSAYHDGELSTEMREVVAKHLAECQRCASQLAEFKSYSDSFVQLRPPRVPPTVWAGIAAKLDQESGESNVVTRRPTDQGDQSWLTTGRLAVAASLLLLLGIGYGISRHSGYSDSHHAEFAATMDHYLTTLSSDPDQAERFLAEKYEGQTVDAEDAMKLVGYRPAVASGLPNEYTLASTSVMRMPCCTCVKAVCKRKDGSTLVLFEHDDGQTDWFGERRSNMATCGDKECCLVDLDSSIAATWKRGSRWFTAVGARDAAEVGDLVSWLENQTSPHSQTLEES